MALPFARALDRMHRAAMKRTADSMADVFRGVRPVASCIAVHLDRNLQMEGAEGRFMTDAVAITALHCDLPKAQAGDVIRIGCERFTVERPLTNDGHAVTYLCMVNQ